MPRHLTPEEKDALREAARDFPPNRLAPFVEEQSRILGCSKQSIYRAVQGVKPRRRRRSDAGAIRAYDEQVFMDLAALTVRHDFNARTAIDILNANRVKHGLAEVDASEKTLQAHLRTRRLSRRDNQIDLRAHRRFEASAPGVLQQFDSTVARQYFIARGGSIGYEAAVHYNKNKAGNGRPRLWYIGGVDDMTRVRWGLFYNSEAATSWLDLMLHAWRKPKDADVWLAYGVPVKVYSDRGSGLRSKLVTSALDQLEVEYAMARPSTEHETNAQAKGKVEATIRVVQEFEKLTKMRRFDSVDELNAAHRKFLIVLNRTPHSETGIAPFHRWVMNAPRVRLLPSAEITRRLSYKVVHRVLTADCTISLDGRSYQLPFRRPFVDHLRTKVEVRYLEVSPEKILVVLDGEEHQVEATVAVPDVAGEFRTAETPASVALKRELQHRDLGHLDPHLVLDYRLEKTATTYIGPRPEEEEHPLAAAAAAPLMVRRGRAKDRLIESGIFTAPPTAFQNAAFERLMDGREELPESELAEWIQARAEDAAPRLRAAHED